MKKCAACKTIKYESEFSKYRDGLQAYCKPCKSEKYKAWAKNRDKERQKAWRVANREHLNSWQLEWYQKNPDKVTEINRRYAYKKRAPKRPPYPKNAYSILVEMFGEICLACGSTEAITIDHIIPLSKGGGSQMDNLQLLCKSCNCSKQANTIDYRFE